MTIWIDLKLLRDGCKKCASKENSCYGLTVVWSGAVPLADCGSDSQRLRVAAAAAVESAAAAADSGCGSVAAPLPIAAETITNTPHSNSSK